MDYQHTENGARNIYSKQYQMRAYAEKKKLYKVTPVKIFLESANCVVSSHKMEVHVTYSAVLKGLKWPIHEIYFNNCTFARLLVQNDDNFCQSTSMKRNLTVKCF